jgi:hypothetical protein
MNSDRQSFSLEMRQSLHSNEEAYARKQSATEENRVLQRQLSSKLREMSFLESEYVKIKKEAQEWKKKFDYVFRENEVLSVEMAKLHATHKQIEFLQQEIQFKTEESEALRGLVTALEASNKKNRRRNVEYLSASLSSSKRTSSSSSDDGRQSRGSAKISSKNAMSCDGKCQEREVNALKNENNLLVKDLDRKEEEIK